MNDPEVQRILDEARRMRQHAKGVRLARLGCRMWAASLALVVACWIAAAWLDSHAFAVTGACLLIPAAIGGLVHGNHYEAEDQEP